MFGFLLILLFQFLGMALHWLGIPLPSGVLGLLLFVFALATGIIQLKWVERAAQFLIKHMILFFIPIIAGLPQISDKLEKDGLALVASTVLSFTAVLLTTGALAQFLIPCSKKILDEENS